MALQGHMWRLITLLEAGDIAAAGRALDAFERLARQRGQPLYRFMATSRRAMRAPTCPTHARNWAKRAYIRSVPRRSASTPTRSSLPCMRTRVSLSTTYG